MRAGGIGILPVITTGFRDGKKKAIYPDFVFSVLTDGQTKRLCVLEMKGDHLAGNERTEYVHNVLSFLTNNFSWDNTQPVGQLELENKGETVTCDLVLFNGWKTRLPAFFN